MIDYELTDKEKRLQNVMAEFCSREIAPRAEILDECPKEEVAKLAKENLQKLADANLLSLGMSEENIDMVCHYVAGEELAKACASTFLCARASTFLCAGILKLLGTPEQKQRLIPDLLKGNLIGALAYSEAEAGSDIAEIGTEAVKEGDSWVINGVKNIVVNAPIADFFVVLAYTNKKAGPYAGMSLFLIDKVNHGLSIGEPIETMGLRGAPKAALYLNDCKVKEIVGDIPENGYAQLKRILEMGTIGVASMCIGVGTACMEKAIQYAKKRKTFGLPIGVHQEIGFKLADIFWNNDIGRMLSLRAAWAFNSGEHESEVLGSCARLFAGEGVTKIANWSMQIFAGSGYFKGSDIERLYRDARFGEICEGTTEIHRLLIAKCELDS